MTRAFAALTIVMATSAALAIITGAQSPATATATPTDAATDRAERWRLDTAYVLSAQSRGVHSSDGELLSTRSATCSFAADGKPWPQLVDNAAVRHHVDQATAADLVDLGVLTLCPELARVITG